MMVSSDARQYTVRFLYSSVPKSVVYLYVIALTSTYTIVAVHTPITLWPEAGHDDGLYMLLGRYLSEGKWLGPFNQFTLMKGPGYPAFLALSHWLGISASLAHALFHCFAVTIFVVVAHRIVKSYVLSGLLLPLLLWHPVSLTISRVVREQIYCSQVLAVVAALAFVLFLARTNKQRIVISGLTGLLLGWFWLTREEGVWIVPGIALLIGAAALPALRERRVAELAGALIIVLAIFAGTQVTFRALNWAVYNKFVGVDFKETNYQRALRALHSVRSGGVRPFVSVTRSARERIYAVSPAFKSLSSYLDGPVGEAWSVHTCKVVPVSCGDLGSGWFMWALRDAAAANGHYSSPSKASAFFGQIADEISAACTRRDLECEPQLIPEMPPIVRQQVVQDLLSRSIDAVHMLILRNPFLEAYPSDAPEMVLSASLRFLNYPRHTRSHEVYTLSGWYYRSGREWISAEVRRKDGSVAEHQLDRNTSPDIALAFGDADASQQRFVIRTRCSDECVLWLNASDGEKVARKLADFRNGAIGFDFRKGRAWVDSTNVVSDPRYKQTQLEKICARIRTFISTHYVNVFLPVLIVGAFAFIVTTLLYWKQAAWNLSYVMALVSWTLVMVRTTLILLIDVTSFPALWPLYLAPAYFVLVCGAVFSVAAGIQLASTPVRNLAKRGGDERASSLSDHR
jgi:hypothetical protein